MRLFPLFTDLHDKSVLVVGGGAVAERKVAALLRSGARVTVVAREFRPELQALADAGRIRCMQGEFAAAMLEGQWLAIAATDDRVVNLQVSAAAGERRMLVNVVDDPEISSFQVPSIVDRAPLVIAISTAGAAPVFARRVRERIEALFDHSLGQLTAMAAARREAIRAAFPELPARRAFYDALFDGPVAVALRRGDEAAAAAAFDQALAQPAMAGGRVIVVGAGPGPAAMLTLQGLRALNEADVILYEDGVSAEVLDLARRDAEVSCWVDGQTGAALAERLAAHARAGRCAVYLCHGDARVSAMDGAGWQGVVWEVVRGVAGL